MATRHGFHRFLQISIHIGIVQNRLRMHTNVVVDDEFQPRQAHTGIGKLTEIKRQLRIAHIHGNLDGDIRHGAALHLGHFGFQQPVIHKTGITLCAAHGNQNAVFERFRCMATAHYGWNAQFARNDGRMAGSATAIGHDGRRALHHRLPVGVRHVGHQNVAGLHLVHLADVVHDAHRSGADFLADGTALDQHVAPALELVAVLGLASALAFDGFGTRLKDVQLAVQPVFAPFDIHGTAVVLLNDQRIRGQFLDVGIAQRIAVAHFGRYIGGLDQLALQRTIGRLFSRRGELHLDEFGAQTAANQRPFARPQHGLVHIELVRVHGALHHRFTQTITGGDEHHVLETRLGVDREHHTRSAQVRADHALNAGTQGHVFMGKTLVHPVADGTVVVKRCEDFPDFVQDRLDTDHIEKRLLLSRKRSVWQVFGRRRRAHRKGGLRVTRGQGGKLGSNGLFQVSRERLCFDPGPNLGAGLGQGPDIVRVEGVQTGIDFVSQAAKAEEIAKSMSRRGKACRHLHARGQVRDHFAEAGVLAAN